MDRALVDSLDKAGLVKLVLALEDEKERLMAKRVCASGEEGCASGRERKIAGRTRQSGQSAGQSSLPPSAGRDATEFVKSREERKPHPLRSARPEMAPEGFLAQIGVAAEIFFGTMVGP
jgi:hypothetical protein